MFLAGRFLMHLMASPCVSLPHPQSATSVFEIWIDFSGFRLLQGAFTDPDWRMARLGMCLRGQGNMRLRSRTKEAQQCRY